MKKKLLAFVLTAAMIISQASVTFAADATDSSTNSESQTPSVISGVPVYPSLTLNKTSLTAYKGKKCTLKATLEEISGTVKWTSSKKSVATVSSKGVITPIKKGTATITATVGQYKATCKVTVKNPIIKLSAKKLTLVKGKSATLKATPYGKSTKVTWKSSKSSVASVSKSGKITAKKVGTAKITAKANGVSASCTITVAKAAMKDVLAAYQKLLRKSYLPYADVSHLGFCLIYANNDNIPELVINSTQEIYAYTPIVYTYVNGKVKEYKYKNNSCLGSASSTLIYRPKKGTFLNSSWVHGYGTINTYYKVDDNGNVKKLSSGKTSGMKVIYCSTVIELTEANIVKLGKTYKSFVKAGTSIK